eukprot:CAMPEP_0204645680 /NCGR_PEP_ID=MMETSP0718-20130828/3338_1 /ASSEMBLY_ACC=CAM_ASM_000674 /TAXON_ID=230516 /ORGANISM="Chaetoceros curvisetus" /LENGTH=221 /DNA_ID=CAMNT_0051667697 /DNA_START=87 /DNA_END=752 /DNA_ORIENTATION=-
MVTEAKSNANANALNENDELNTMDDNDDGLELHHELKLGNHDNVNDDAKDASIHQQSLPQKNVTSVEWDKGVELLLDSEGEHGKAMYEYTSPKTTRSLRNALNRNYASDSREEAYEMLNALGELSQACGANTVTTSTISDSCACTASPGREGRDDESSRDNSDTEDERQSSVSSASKLSSDSKMQMQGQKVLQARMTDLRRNIFALDRNSSYNLGSRGIKQ